MKKVLYILLLVTVFTVDIVKVDASSGQLRKASIKTCNGITYGQHSSDNHWHVAEEQDGRYYATGNPIYSDPCNSNNIMNDVHPEDVSDNGSDSYSNNTSVESSLVETEEIKSNDNTIKVITIDGEEIEISDVMNYSTTKDNVEINVTTNDTNATYEIKNNSTLSIGDNVVTIDVKAEDGSIKNYIINIKREVPLSSDTGIKVTINDEEVIFNNYKATVYVSSSTTDINIDYKLNDESAKVEIDEPEKLQTGDNKLKIKVIAEDESEQEYEITIYKYSKMQDVVFTIISFAIVGGIGCSIYFAIKKSKKK